MNLLLGFCATVDAEFRNELSEGILQMQESGKLSILKIKWWKEKRGGGACQVRGKRSRKAYNLDLLSSFIWISVCDISQHEQCLRQWICPRIVRSIIVTYVNTLKLFLDCSYLFASIIRYE